MSLTARRIPTAHAAALAVIAAHAIKFPVALEVHNNLFRASVLPETGTEVGPGQTVPVTLRNEDQFCRALTDIESLLTLGAWGEPAEGEMPAGLSLLIPEELAARVAAEAQAAQVATQVAVEEQPVAADAAAPAEQPASEPVATTAGRKKASA